MSVTPNHHPRQDDPPHRGPQRRSAAHHLVQCSVTELHRHSRSAERGMNRALEQRRWIMARHQRNHMRAVEVELRRRLHEVPSPSFGAR